MKVSRLKRDGSMRARDIFGKLQKILNVSYAKKSGFDPESKKDSLQDSEQAILLVQND